MPSGSCICGALTYSFNVPVMKALCHCLTCRKVTGSTYLTSIMVKDDDFTTNASTCASHKTFDTKHEVGMPITFHFCSDCGTKCWKTAGGWPGAKIIFAGTLDGETDLEDAKPDAELWTKYRVGWAPKTAAQEFAGFPEN